MNASRAKEIIKKAKEMAKGYPWVEAVPKVMTPEERKEVITV